MGLAFAIYKASHDRQVRFLTGRIHSLEHELKAAKEAGDPVILRDRTRSRAEGDRSIATSKRWTHLASALGSRVGDVKPLVRWLSYSGRSRRHRGTASAGRCLGRCVRRRLAEVRYLRRCGRPKQVRVGFQAGQLRAVGRPCENDGRDCRCRRDRKGLCCVPSLHGCVGPLSRLHPRHRHPHQRSVIRRSVARRLSASSGL